MLDLLLPVHQALSHPCGEAREHAKDVGQDLLLAANASQLPKCLCNEGKLLFPFHSEECILLQRLEPLEQPL
jgi:hypothetical protein